MTIPPTSIEAKGTLSGWSLDYLVRSYDQLWEIALLTRYTFYDHIKAKATSLASDCVFPELSNILGPTISLFCCTLIDCCNQLGLLAAFLFVTSPLSIPVHRY